MTTHIIPPRRFRPLIERVRDRDRAYFEKHPGATEYLRPYVPGEFWPVAYPDATHVLVTQIVPGFRTKTILICREGVNEPLP